VRLHGVKVSYAAIRLARTLGERGVSLWLSDDGRLGVRPASALRAQDRDAIRALWHDLAVIALADVTEPAAEQVAPASGILRNGARCVAGNSSGNSGGCFTAQAIGSTQVHSEMSR
jgi:hypothetical protein